MGSGRRGLERCLRRLCRSGPQRLPFTSWCGCWCSLRGGGGVGRKSAGGAVHSRQRERLKQGAGALSCGRRPLEILRVSLGPLGLWILSRNAFRRAVYAHTCRRRRDNSEPCPGCTRTRSSTFSTPMARPKASGLSEHNERSIITPVDLRHHYRGAETLRAIPYACRTLLRQASRRLDPPA